MHIRKKMIAALLLITLLCTLLPPAAAAPRAATRAIVLSQKVSDIQTVGEGIAAAHISTQVDGKVWLDKSVSATGGMFAAKNGFTLGADEFEVALSAIAQTFPVTSTSQIMEKKANVVFAIDASSSMTQNYLTVDGVKRSRLYIMQEVGKNFIDTLAAMGAEYTINVSIVIYAGQGFIYQEWLTLDDTTQVTLKNKIGSINTPSTAMCSGATSADNTNTQAGAYMARLLFADTYAEELNRPANYNDKTTNNFVILMTDGAPNRYYADNSTGTPGAGATVTDIPVGYDSGHDMYYTTATAYNASTGKGLSRLVNASTDYKKMAAYTYLQQIEALKSLHNSTVFSLGLGEWFVEEGESSGFLTATNLCQLAAAVGNGTRDPSNGEIVTSDYCWNNYLGYDVPDGAMPGINPQFPLTPDTTAEYQARFITGGYYFFSKNKSGTRYYFSSWQAMLDALNLPNPTDTFVDAKTGATVTKQQAFLTTVIRPEDAQFPTIAECGIPYVPDGVLSQVIYYYAGNTADKFATSMADISTAITVSFENYITSTTANGDPLVDGAIRFVDTLGDGMEYKRLLGVQYNGSFFTCSNEAKILLNFTEYEWNESEQLRYTEWCNEMRFSYGTTITRQMLETLVTTSVAGGSIYYNSDTDCGTTLTMYSRYVASTGSYQYLAPYFTADGAVAAVPEGATHIMRHTLIANDVDGEVLVGETTSLLYLRVACAESLATGRQSMLVYVPASLVPVRTVVTTNGVAHLLKDIAPMSASFVVGLRDDLTAAQLEASASTDENGDTVHTFYTNYWADTGAQGPLLNDKDTTYCTFTANPLSPYYQAVDDVLLYVPDADETSGYRPAVEGDSAPFYIHNVFHCVDGDEISFDELSVYYPDALPELMTRDEVTNYYIPAGTMRYDSTIEEEVLKFVSNITETYRYCYDATFVGNTQSETTVHAHMGNNGKLTVGESTVEDYAVVDYGLPVTLGMDGFDTLTALNEAAVTAVGASADAADESTAQLGCGTLAVKEGSLQYTPQSTRFGEVDTGYFVCRALLDGNLTLLKGTVHLVPATNLTFEEQFLTFHDADGAAWSQQGTPLAAEQSSQNSGYGYDEAYASNNASTDSMGSSMMATVSDPLVQPYAEFTFTGTGFDILSRTGADCGVMLVELRRDNARGALQKVLIVDNYLAAETLYQLPVVHQMLDTCGEYYVKVSAYYNRVFDHALRGSIPGADRLCALLGYPSGTPVEYYTAAETRQMRTVSATAGQYNVYLDGIRVYNPLGTALTSDDGIAYTAYSEANELNPSYVQLRSSLLNAQSWSNTEAVTIDGAVYLAGSNSNAAYGDTVSRPGIYLGSSGQIKMDETGALLDETGALLQLQLTGGSYNVYCYNGTVNGTTQADGSVVYTDESGGVLTSRLYYVNQEGESVYLTARQENELNICFYDGLYKTDSPKNEVYLRDGQAVAFNVDSSSHIQISMKSPNGKTVQLCVYDTVGKVWVQLSQLSSSTEQFVDVSEWIYGGVCIFKCAAADADAVLSVVNVKITNDAGDPTRMHSTLSLVYDTEEALSNNATFDPYHVHSFHTQVVTEATCTQDGLNELRCDCGECREQPVAAFGHRYVGEQTRDAACLQAGEMTYTCANCGNCYYEPIAALGHSFTTTTEPATCTQSGETKETCTRCGETHSRTVAALGHQLQTVQLQPAASDTDELLQITCAVCGLQYTQPGEQSFRARCAHFTDIPADWSRDGLLYAAANGWLKGTGEHTLSPDALLTRAMLVTVLWRMDGQSAASAAAPFTDCDMTAYYAPALNWAYENGLVQGVSGKTFAPHAAITREEFAVVLARYARKTGAVLSGGSLAAFTDADTVSSWALPALQWAVGTGLLKGVQAQTLGAKDPTSRAQAAAVLLRLQTLLPN